MNRIVTRMNRIVTALAASVLVACSGGVGAPVKIDDLGTRTAEVSCAKMFQCCTDAEIMTLNQGGPGFTDEASCRQVYAGFITAFLTTPLEESISKNRSTYDGSKLGTCLGKASSLSCAEYSASRMSSSGSDGLFGNLDEAACKAWLSPNVSAGGACRNDFECIGGVGCMGANSGAFGGTPKDGTCGAAMSTVKDGDPCPMNFNCGEGFYCDGVVQPPTCRALKDNGAQCDFGGFCKSGRCVMNQCAPKAIDGATCSSSSECQSNWCDGANGGMGTCKQPKADGEACQSGTECMSATCQNGKCGSPSSSVKCSGR